MFGFFKRKAHTDSTPVAMEMSPWQMSEEEEEEEELIDQIGEYTYAKLERMKVDLKGHKFKAKDGKALSIDQVARRLHRAKPHIPLLHIEDSVMSWLEEAYEPEGITDGDMEEEAQMKIETWLEAHEEARQISSVE